MTKLKEENKVYLDENKFYAQLSRSRVLLDDIANELLMKKCNLERSIRKGWINRKYALRIEERFGITPEMYAPAERLEPATTEAEKSLDYDEIRSAVSEAVDYEKLRKIITAAVFDALVSISTELENSLGRVVGSNVKAGIREALNNNQKNIRR